MSGSSSRVMFSRNSARNSKSAGGCVLPRPVIPFRASVHNEAKAVDFFDLKGDVEDVLDGFPIARSISIPTCRSITTPDAAARIVVDGATIGYVGQLHPAVAESPQIEAGCLHRGDSTRATLPARAAAAAIFEPISRYPAVERDFSFVFDDAVTFERVREAVSP